MAFNFTAMSDEAVFREAAKRTETLLHLARAHAATNGRRVQLAFERDPVTAAEHADYNLWRLAVLWEPDPLLRPYQFEPLPAPSWDIPGINARIGVESVTIHGDHSGARLFLLTQPRPTQDGQETEDTTVLPSILFYPDGSCDNASIVLASRTEQDRRRLRLEIRALTGLVESHAMEDRQVRPPGVPASAP